VGGEKVRYIVLDDATDPSTAVKNARKLTGEDKVDAIIGSSVTPTSMAMLEVAFETKTPQLAMAPVPPAGDKAPWIFSTPQSFNLMAVAIAQHMAANNVKTVGFIGYADPYGELWLKALQGAVEGKGINIVAVERYQSQMNVGTALPRRAPSSTASAHPPSGTMATSCRYPVAPPRAVWKPPCAWPWRATAIASRSRAAPNSRRASPTPRRPRTCPSPLTTLPWSNVARPF